MDKRIFNDQIHYFTYVMEKYFRKSPPAPTHIYLKQEAHLGRENRLKLAQECQYPAILNTLANDQDEEVRQAVRRNEYWRLVGRHQDILGFERRERKEFARHERGFNLFTLLMFEKDLDVLKEVLRNPSLSIQMLVQYFRWLDKRGQGKKDQQIFELCKQVIQERKEQIIKISNLQKAMQQPVRPDNLKAILNSAAEQSYAIIKVIQNFFTQLRLADLQKFVATATKPDYFQSELDRYLTLTALLQSLHQRDDLWSIPVTYLNREFHTGNDRKDSNIGDYFNHLLREERYRLVKRIAGDLTDFNHILILSHVHIDEDQLLNQMAANIMPVDDLLQLINDATVPRRYFKEVLKILNQHKEKSVREKVHSSYLQESQKMKKQLREVELSVQAYFDIIFQSVGYDRIYALHEAMQSFRNAIRQYQKFEPILHDQPRYRPEVFTENLEKQIASLQARKKTIYQDISPEVIHELNYIQSVVDEIFQLKELGVNMIRPGTPSDLESELRAKARMIWRNALNTYLGRIKDFSEMLQLKITGLSRQQDFDLDIKEEMETALRELEREYKGTVHCQLKIACTNCSRRGCASERFLTEVRFLLQELFDNFSNEASKAEKEERVLLTSA